MQAIFGYLVMRTVQDGEKLSWGALNTCSKLMISPLSEGWFIIYDCFHSTAVSQQLENTDAKKTFKCLVFLTLIFASKDLSFFFCFLHSRECVLLWNTTKISVAKFLEDLRYLTGAFNSQRILSWNENLLLHIYHKITKSNSIIYMLNWNTIAQKLKQVNKIFKLENIADREEAGQ